MSFIKSGRGDIVRITSLCLSVTNAEGWELKTKNYKTTIHVPRYEF
ncbi:hypothetical protein OAK75_10300 [Bacteriovoracales bacterium]|nr:hypothetical protein [Bacteriovoracales bacterium]